MHYNMHCASYACCRDPSGPHMHYIMHCITRNIMHYIAICITICILRLMHAAGTLRDPTEYIMHATGTLRDPTGPWPGRAGGAAAAAGGGAGQMRTLSPSHTGITSRAHTASRRDHVTDTEHDFPVGGDGQAGLTTPKPPINTKPNINQKRCHK